MPKRVVYQIKNTENGKKYIGSTSEKRHRWNVHKSLLDRKDHHSIHLQRAWNKYGPSSFEFSVLEEVEDEENLLEVEQEYLDEIEPEYNIAKDAEAPMKGREMPEEFSQKISEINSGKSHPLYGKGHTEKSKKRISKNHADMSGENNPFYGKEHTEESLKKMSESSKGRQKGENHPDSKLTKKEVKAILRLLESGNFTQIQIAKKYGVNNRSISNIKLNKTWSHVKIS